MTTQKFKVGDRVKVTAGREGTVTSYKAGRYFPYSVRLDGIGYGIGYDRCFREVELDAVHEGPKVGDKVCVNSNCTAGGGCWIGQIGVVVEVDNSIHSFPYRVKFPDRDNTVQFDAAELDLYNKLKGHKVNVQLNISTDIPLSRSGIEDTEEISKKVEAEIKDFISKSFSQDHGTVTFEYTVEAVHDV